MIESLRLCQFLMELLVHTKTNEKLSPGGRKALQDDIELINFLILKLSAPLSRQDIIEIWQLVNEASHYFGGYVPGLAGSEIENHFSKLYMSIFSLYQAKEVN